jgi:hypothetical protein
MKDGLWYHQISDTLLLIITTNSKKTLYCEERVIELDNLESMALVLANSWRWIGEL